MKNIWIVSPIYNEAEDYSYLISSLSGNYVTQDIEVETTDENGQVVISYEPHPDQGLAAPDFSGKIVFVHNGEHGDISGVHDLDVSGDFNIAKMWNEGFAYAKSNGATHVAILNAVSKINPHIIVKSVDEFENSSVVNIADGTAFIINTNSEILADEQFKVYFADLDLFKRAGDIDSLAFGSYPSSEIEQIQLTDFAISMKSVTDEDGVKYSEKYA